jgi:hypothetical protein
VNGGLQPGHGPGDGRSEPERGHVRPLGDGHAAHGQRNDQLLVVQMDLCRVVCRVAWCVGRVSTNM